MRYLVTGGLGVIGSTIARRLLAAGHWVKIIDSAEEVRNLWIRQRLADDFGDSTFGSRMAVATWRLEHTIDLAKTLNDVDAVIHCAASTGIPYSGECPDDDWERNVESTRCLLNALREVPRPTVVLSSIKPYWVPPRASMGAGLDEHALLDPDEPYAASKAAQSMLCVSYARSYGVPVVTFRCSNLYGAAPCHGPRHGWLTWFCISAAIGRPLVVQGTGNQARDMLYGDDVYSACMAALARSDELRGEVFNLGGGRDNIISVNEAANLLHELTGVEVTKGEPRKLDDDLVFVTTEKFRNATGWSPLVNVQDGLREVLKWAQANKADLAGLYEGTK